MKKIKIVLALSALLICFTFTQSPAQEAGGSQQPKSAADSAQTDTTAKRQPDSLKAAPTDTLKTQSNAAAQQNDTTKTAPASSSASADTSGSKTAPDTARAAPPAAALPTSGESQRVIADTAASAAPGNTQRTITSASSEAAGQNPGTQVTSTPASSTEPPQAEKKSPVSTSQQPAAEADSLSGSQPARDTLPAETALPQSRQSQAGAIPAWIFWVIGLLGIGVISTVVFLRRSRYGANSPQEPLRKTIPPVSPQMKPQPLKKPAPVKPEPAKEITLTKGKLLLSHARHSGARREQQDALVFSEPESALTHQGVLIVLADGMSGHACGKEAAEAAVNAFRQAYETKSPEEAVSAALERALKTANGAVIALAKERREENNVGSTLTAAVIENRALHWISVGDTRLYILRMGQLTQLTVDHIYLNKLLEEAAAGKMEKAEARKHPDREALYSFLGLKELREIGRSKDPYPLQTGDRLLLCSEGLHKTLSKNEIRETLGASSNAPGELLVKKALGKKKSAQENISAISIILE